MWIVAGFLSFICSPIFLFFLLQKKLYPLFLTTPTQWPPAKTHLLRPASSYYPPLMWPECLTVPALAPRWLSESSTWSSLGRMRAVTDLTLLDDVGTTTFQTGPTGRRSCQGTGSSVGTVLHASAAWNEVILRTGICMAAFQSPSENLESDKDQIK